jgi:hypothetical protein
VIVLLDSGVLGLLVNPIQDVSEADIRHLRIFAKEKAMEWINITI